MKNTTEQIISDQLFDALIEKDTDNIIIANGDMFSGTREQFTETYFPNATNQKIKSWCIKNKLMLKINKFKII